MVDNFEILIKKAAETAAKVALKTYEDKQKADIKALNDRKLHNTKMLLSNYRLLSEHVDNATYKREQIDTAEAINWINEMYDPNNKADVIVNSIKNSAIKTRIMVAHINKMLKIYKLYCNSDNSPKMLRRFEVLSGRYISTQRVKYEDIAEKWGVDVRTIQSDIKDAILDFSQLLFGIDWLNNLQ